MVAGRSSEIRARRLRTLDAVADMSVLPVDEEAAQLWALLRVHRTEAEPDQLSRPAVQHPL
ncbi:hypothetical protein AU187_18905 [Mycobacterium sp. IS-1556]|nr:hypothetical protein AU187_18905 [Mycobacterium sp. IS-1556]